MRPSFVFLLVATACALPARPPECGAGTRRAVAVDEPIGTGFTAEEVLAFASGAFVVEAWDGEEQPEELTVDIAPRGRVLACEAPGAVELTDGGQPVARVDRLDIELEIALSTADGRFDGRPKRAFASTEDGVTVDLVYEIDAPEPGYVRMVLAEDHFAGEVGAGGGVLLVWPYDAAAGE